MINLIAIARTYAPSLSCLTQHIVGANSTKERRQKRSEEQRTNFFRTEPYIAQFEAYRILCAGCDKWVGFLRNSSYCPTPWEPIGRVLLLRKDGFYQYLNI